MNSKQSSRVRCPHCPEKFHPLGTQFCPNTGEPLKNKSPKKIVFGSVLAVAFMMIAAFAAYQHYFEKEYSTSGHAVDDTAISEKERSGKSRLFVETEPEDARVKILGIKPKFHQGMELEPRRYQLEISAKGCKSRKEWAEITEGEDTNLTIRLEPKGKLLKGCLFVETEPEDAKVKILGIKPKFRQGIELKPGRYRIQASAKGYKSQKEWVKIAPGEDARLNVRLEQRENIGLEQKEKPRRSARLFVNTMPEDARVRILNIGLNFGQGMELRPDNYHVEVSANGYETQTEWIELVANEVRTLDIHMNLKRESVPKGRLFVEVEPENAKINFPGTESNFYQGIELDPGLYVVEVLANGYKGWREQAEIVAGQDKRLKIHLKPMIRTATSIPPKSSASSDGLPYKIALFAWMAEDSDQSRTDKIITRVINEKKDVFTLKYKIGKKDVGRKIGGTVIDADMIEKAWLTGSFFSNPKPNVKTVCRLGEKWRVDLVLMGKDAQTFLIDTKTCKIFSVSGFSMVNSLTRVLKEYTGTFDSGLERFLHDPLKFKRDGR